jgi:hypothetical protein
MKTLLNQSMRATLALLLLLGLSASVAFQGRMQALPVRLQVATLVLVAGAVLCIALFAVLLRRVRGEDRIAGLEAALCREQHARSQADQALAESDLLLGRLSARGNGRRGGVDAVAQLATIQAELIQLRQHCVLDDPLLASRVDLLCTRVACVAQAVETSQPVASG